MPSSSASFSESADGVQQHFDFRALKSVFSDEVLVVPALYAYIVKHLEKTGEKIVYSKGLPQFFISDIMEEDVACPFGLEDKKLLLFDDFVCWDEGVSMGKVSKQTIAQMPKAY